VVVLLGAAVILWVTSPGEQLRRRAMRGVEVGADSGTVVAELGAPPARCSPRVLRHLAPAFPPGWPQASIDAALLRLEADTRERWVYPIKRRAPGCAPRSGQTEVGIAHDGKVLWLVTVTGKTPLALPEELAPATPDAPVSR
jgi:hypothetical protein